MNTQNASELTDKDFMEVYGESAGIGGRFLLFFLGLFVAIFGFFVPGYTIHRVMQILKKVSNYGDGEVKTMWSLTKEYV
jgi:Na+/H+ antiporter NhaD/arsenite permease-like protein